MPVLTSSYKGTLLKVLFALIAVLVYCEYAIYYVVLSQCKWPELDAQKVDRDISLMSGEEAPVNAMFLSDTHLLGSRNGHWFDKLKRSDAQRMANAQSISDCNNYTQAGSDIYFRNSDFKVFLPPDQPYQIPDSDIFDEGLWCSAAEFDRYVARFNSLFYVPKTTRLYVVSGNHDMGFHYEIIPYLNQRFINAMKSPNARKISIRGNHFVLLNSMALEGDGCFLCRPTEIAINKISKQLKCFDGIGRDCKPEDIENQYSRPILLQHYPMYRESDEICNELDEAPASIKNDKFREGWDCLSREASNQLLDVLNPRLVIDGHTHHGCRRILRDNILEFTVASFSWRNKNNPSFLLGVFTPNNYAISKCYMPVETTVTRIYISSIICISIYLALKTRRRFFRNRFQSCIFSTKISEYTNRSNVRNCN